MSKAKFLEGSTMQHVIVMSSTAAAGLMALFLVDLLDIYFLSMLDTVEIISAVGYASSILFVTTSVGIGMAISMGALVAKNMGAGRQRAAREFATSTLFVVFTFSSLLAILIFIYGEFLLVILGAQGDSLIYALEYLNILIPSIPFLGAGIACGGALRGVGDARGSMNSTLYGAILNAILDPIFILYLNWGISGAAWATFAARITIFLVAFMPLLTRHKIFERYSNSLLKKCMPAILGIAVPATLTNVSTPIANAFVTAAMAQYGDIAVAGFSIIGRLTPVAFGVVFAVSGAVGPIIGQNYGAGLWPRVRQTFKDGVKFVLFYSLVIWSLLILLQDVIAEIFQMEGLAFDVLVVFCFFMPPAYIFSGITFVGNAAFNNLGRPVYSLIVNMTKATLGTVPFIYTGAYFGGAPGILIGQAAGYIVFGVISWIGFFWLLKGFNIKSSSSEPLDQPS